MDTKISSSIHLPQQQRGEGFYSVTAISGF
jgi:hypothetical protein